MTSNGASDSRFAPSADDTLLLRFPAQPHEVAPARHAVQQYLIDRGVTAEVTEDLQLVTSELVTNGILHGEPGWISVEVDVDGRAVRLRVTNEGPSATIPPVSEWRPATGTALSGRGLGIVRQLVDEAEVAGDEHVATVQCRRLLHVGAST